VVQENDPLRTAESLMNVQFLDNGIEPLNKAQVWEKSMTIAEHAKSKLQSQAIVEQVEQTIDFD
jgi:exonuclease VII small subunit